MYKKLIYMVALVSAFAFAACDTNRNSDSTDVASEANAENIDKLEEVAEFAVDAADDGIFEVEVGKLAAKKASSSRVKQFAQLMVTDHARANDDLRRIAREKGIALPDIMSENRQEDYYSLDRKQGDDFDREYIDLMVRDHKDALDRFERAADDNSDPEVQAWAREKVPTLQHHLEEAERIRDSLKEGRSQS